MAIQKFRKVEGFDNIEKFLGKSISGFSISWHKQLARTYCKCGKVYVGELEKCECGNPITEHFYFYNNLQSFESSYEKDSFGRENGKLNIFLKQLCFSVEDKEKVLKIMLKNLEILSLEENYLNEVTSNLKEIFYKSNFEEFLDTEIRKHPYYNSFSFWYEKFLNRDYYTKRISGVLKSIEKIFNLEKDYPKIMKNSKIYQYPYLTSELMLRQVCKDDLDDLFALYYGDDKSFEYMECLNYYIMQSRGEGFYNESSIPLFRKFKKFVFEKEIKSLDFKNSLDLINHYVLNHQLSLNDAVNILELVKSIYDNPTCPKKFNYYYKYFNHYYHKKEDPLFKDFFKVEYLKYFDTYLKENISIVESKENLVYDFIDRINDMIKIGIPIKRDNFKIKNYNWLYTSQKMAESYKLPEGKVSLFLDWFETNPLESLELVSNRRKLTDKQINLIIDKLIK